MKYCIVCLLFVYSCAGSAQIKKADKASEKKENVLETKSEINKKSEEAEVTETPETPPFELTEFNSQKFSGGAPGSNTV